MAHAWKACWVQALGGSNPPSSATGPRDLLRFRGFCCLSRRVISGRRESCPPASRPRRVLLLVVPLVFWAPSGPAAHEIATRELRSEWSISKPARALRTLRRPPHRRRCVADVWPGASSRSPARPRRPRGGLQSGVRVCALALPPPTGAATSLLPCRPRGGLRAGHPRNLVQLSNFARNSLEDVSGFEIGSLIFRGF